MPHRPRPASVKQLLHVPPIAEAGAFVAKEGSCLAASRGMRDHAAPRAATLADCRKQWRGFGESAGFFVEYPSALEWDACAVFVRESVVNVEQLV